MEIARCNRKTKCDFDGCNNLAEYCFSCKGFFRKDLCFCQDCMKGMLECISKIVVPKGTNSPFKLNKRLKDEKH